MLKHSLSNAAVRVLLACLLAALLFFSGWVALAQAQSGAILRVKMGGLTSGSCGSDWNSACDLQYAISQASAGAEIWVAAGTYTPGSARADSFTLKDGVAIYGGFSGTEANRGDRSVTSNLTTLSGDIGTVDDSSDNSYHLVKSSGVTSSAVLDGFTITGGNANGSFPGDRGGGMYNISNSSPTLSNLTFTGNSAAFNGGGMYNDYSSPTLTNVTFTGNRAVVYAGGMGSIHSSPTLTNVIFSGNSAAYGGGMSSENFSSPTLTNVTFTGNSATDNGGGMRNFGGSSTLTNVTFSGNRASYGGGMDNGNSGSTVRNSILWGNTAGIGAQVSGNTPVYTKTIVQNDASGNSQILTVDPLFVDATSGDLYLQATSSAIDAGNSAVTDPALPTTDLDGNPRIIGAAVDLGAYEFNPVRYVNGANTAVLHNGRTWATAFTDLQQAISLADSGEEIWVAAGTYTPGSARADSFTLKDGVAIYGGFAGTEISRDARSVTSNLTTLSGDIGTAGDSSDNSYHVVKSSGVTSSAMLDGFTITGGNANSNSYPDYFGGGMFNDSSSPTLTKLSFTGNTTATDGGGMYNYNTSNPTLTNVTFSGNSAANAGGGMRNNNSSPTLTNVTFTDNSAGGGGGGIENYNSSPTLTNVTFTGNSAANNGGGMENYNSSPTLTNVTFFGNSAYHDGSGMDNSNSSPTVRNSILWGNTGAGGVQVSGGTPVYTKTIVQGGVRGSAEVFDLDPLFVDAASGDLHLQATSPAIDTGNSAVTNPVLPAADLEGNPRIFGAAVDLGAYENQSNPTRLYVNGANTAVLHNGRTWATAFTDLQQAISQASAGAEIWVAAGTYTPGSARADSFSLKDGVAIYGGFAGTETNRGDRSVTSNLTTLISDIGTVDNSSDNSYHVVKSSGATSSAVLDGFTITGGNANGSNFDNYGGGMVNYNSSPTLSNLNFTGNNAVLGGGMYNYNTSSPTLTHVTFTGNSAANAGGGMFNDHSSPTLSNVTFTGSSATGNGGGMYNEMSSPTLSNVTFTGSSTTNNGGGMYNSSSRPTLTNVTFSGNSATGNGGGMNNLNNSSPKVRNSILWGNTAGSGAQVSGDTPVYTKTIVQGGVSGNAEVFDLDPLFVGAASGDLHLQSTSPAIDAGNSAVTDPVLPATDLDGNPRIVGAAVDLGAYENQSNPTRLYVNGADTAVLHNGRSWVTAFTDLQQAISQASAGAEIWVAKGTYTPTSGTDRTLSFTLNGGVAIYGGFAGTETNRGDRSVTSNLTTLSGDIGAAGDSSDNSYHVVKSSGATSSAVLDGFTITGGNADSNSYPDYYGGGMYNYSSSPTLSNLTFSGNSATSGGGMENFASSSPTLTNVTFSGNSAAHEGGGMVNVTSSNPTLTNVTFTGNSANYGGGMGNFNNSSPKVRNSILWGNTAATDAQVGGDTPVYTKTIVQNDTSGNAEVLTGDPLLAPLGNYGGATQTIALLPGSAAIDAATSNCPTTDQRGEARSSPNCDLGAFESQGFQLTVSAGDNQSTPIHTPFAQALVVTVSATKTGEPVNGGKVTFTPPSSNASATLPVNPGTISSAEVRAAASANGLTGGPYLVTASAAGATSQNFHLTNAQGSQAITFAALSGKAYGDADFDVNATASSGLPVSFMATGNCSIATGTHTVHITGAGNCIITASQSGDANYVSASDVPQSFSISKATATLTFSNLSQTYDGTLKAVTVTTTPDGLTGVSITYDGSATAPTNASSYAVVGSLTNDNYQAADVKDTLVISNSAPTISAIGDQTIDVDTSTPAVPFTIGDAEIPVAALHLSAESTNTSLVPVANIVFGGDGNNRTLTITPAAHQKGTATLRITVSDGDLTASTSFLLTVSAVNDLKLSATVSPEPVLAGNPLTYTLSVANLNPDPASGLTLTALLADELVFAPASSSSACQVQNHTVTCTPNDIIPAQGQMQFVIAAIVPADTLAGTQVPFSATVTAAQNDPDRSNNTLNLSSSVVTEKTVYTQDDPGDGKWSDPGIKTTPCGGIKFLGEFGNQTVTLSLPSLLVHQRVEVSFDLLILRSWDGNQTLSAEEMQAYLQSGSSIGPDIWQLSANSQNVLTTTFANWDNPDFRQAYPGQYPGGDYPARTGSVANNQMCYDYYGIPMDALYHMTFILDNTDPTLALDFLARGLQSIQDESWGLANVQVKVISSNNNASQHLIYLPLTMK